MMGEALMEPIYDNKVEMILRGLMEGKSREDLSEQLKYKSYKSLEIYMRRKNWKWNSKAGTYEPCKPSITFEDKLSEVKTMGTKIGRAIELFKSGIVDPMIVAKKVGFINHIDMAEYMKKNNYLWDNEKGNYVAITGKIQNNISEVNKVVMKEAIESLDDLDLKQYMPLLKMLQNNKDKLIDIFNSEIKVQSIPTYLVPGIPTVLSAQMMSSLKFLLKDYSDEKNVTQRQILEVALIEFFNKYGYSQRASTMLNV